MLDQIRAKRDDAYELAKKHKVERLWVFGSCARKEETATSDIDILIKFNDIVGHRDYEALENGFAALFGRKVEVVSSGVLRSSPRFAARVCAEAVAI